MSTITNNIRREDRDGTSWISEMDLLKCLGKMKLMEGFELVSNETRKAYRHCIQDMEELIEN